MSLMYPFTNKSIGIGKTNISFKFGDTEINPGSWIYIDSNGWVEKDKNMDNLKF